MNIKLVMKNLRLFLEKKKVFRVQLSLVLPEFKCSLQVFLYRHFE
jgi:hypothetical protein